jgi:G:T-mismatch repair DNA endonuclease (very short patch repair protein)
MVVLKRLQQIPQKGTELRKRLKGNRVLSEHYFRQHSVTKGSNDWHRDKPLYVVCLFKQVHGCFWYG